MHRASLHRRVALECACMPISTHGREIVRKCMLDTPPNRARSRFDAVDVQQQESIPLPNMLTCERQSRGYGSIGISLVGLDARCNRKKALIVSKGCACRSSSTPTEDGVASLLRSSKRCGWTGANLDRWHGIPRSSLAFRINDGRIKPTRRGMVRKGSKVSVLSLPLKRSHN